MHGLREIHHMNRVAADLPQTKREAAYRVQRDKLAQALRRVLAEEIPRGRTPKMTGAVEFAEDVLTECGL